MIANVKTAALLGFDGALVEVETDSKQGLPGIQIVGMGSRAIDEARERVRSAIRHSLLPFPSRKITINLAPAELPKEGAHFDLPIALSILVASGQLRQTEVNDALFAGELALDGTLRPIRGVISIAETAQLRGYGQLFVPEVNAPQAALIDGITVYAVASLQQLYLHLKGEVPLSPTLSVPPSPSPHLESITLDDIHGQEQAKRALQIAVAGRHNILLYGPPGTGKTMLAQSIISLLSPLSFSEQLVVTKIHSLMNGSDGHIITQRPFRSPHHSASSIALLGGGAKAKPGEITLAHLGVLFLDELPEYPRQVLESLRQPLEDRSISIARVHGRIIYPADFMLVATMNPCPCGYYGDSDTECTCSSTQILNYQKRLSGPLFDRIDLVIQVPKLSQNTLLQYDSLHKNQHPKVLASIDSAIKHQRDRYKSSTIYNGSLSSKAVKNVLTLTAPAKELLELAATRLKLSPRSYFKLIKVAQTIADLAGDSSIEPNHVSEALQFRGRINT